MIESLQLVWTFWTRPPSWLRWRGGQQLEKGPSPPSQPCVLSPRCTGWSCPIPSHPQGSHSHRSHTTPVQERGKKSHLGTIYCGMVDLQTARLSSKVSCDHSHIDRMVLFQKYDSTILNICVQHRLSSGLKKIVQKVPQFLNDTILSYTAWSNRPVRAPV